MEKGKTIVLNRMFQGDYLNQNLGHEVINLYQADNGKHYIYLNPYGNFSTKQQDKTGAVLLVRTVPNQAMVEVLGLAEGIKDVYRPFQPEGKDRQYIDTHNITYGGVKLYRLFDANEKKQTTYLTFEAERIVKPAKTCYIKFATNGEQVDSKGNMIVLRQNNQAKASLKQYIDPTTPDDYQALFDFINDERNWGDPVEQVTDKTQVQEKEINFFEICGIEDWELSFSNALAYFIRKYPELLSVFAKTLGVDYTPSPKMTLRRETVENIDLYIEDNDRIIVIENKIKSHINGRIFNRKSAEDDQSQLSKYYRHALGEATKQHKKVSCYLLAPDYNDINLAPYKDGDKYRKVFYSQVYRFLTESETVRRIDDPYLKEFIRAMEKHTRLVDNQLYEAMMQRFYSIIQSHR